MDVIGALSWVLASVSRNRINVRPSCVHEPCRELNWLRHTTSAKYDMNDTIVSIR